MLASLHRPSSVPPPTVEELSAWASVRPRRVLVVDDSQTNRMLIRVLLERAGFEVAVADGGEAAVAMVADAVRPPDAVLMDVSMPDVDGLAATARIRSLPPPRGSVVIIAVSANDLPEDRQNCLDAGMNDFVTKPAGKYQLLAALHRCLGSPAEH